MKRGIIYYLTNYKKCWKRRLEILLRAIQSAKPLNLPIIVFSDLDVPQEIKKLAKVINPGEMHYRKFRAEIYDLSPFEQTLHLDADTVLMGNIQQGWEKSKKHGMALTICPDCTFQHQGKELIKYAPNVIFFEKQPIVKKVFDTWKDLMKNEVVTCEDPYLSIACENLQWQPFILPGNWNYKPDWRGIVCGQIKFWNHVTDPTEDANKTLDVRYQSRSSFITLSQRIKMENQQWML